VPIQQNKEKPIPLKKQIMEINFTELQITVQQIIDLIAAKDLKAANNKLVDASEILDELLDHAEEEEQLIEISKYQVLINQLHQKINVNPANN
jgi:hypothetical protein